MRTAVYCGTRNMYGDMETACKSLLFHKGADQVFFLIEDDAFPSFLPPCVKVRNVSGQTYFPLDGPNAQKHWTWMVLMKLAMHRLFPKLGKVLVLDNDTIVTEPIDALWDIDLSGHLIAGASEPDKTAKYGKLYINAGVMLQDLNALRRTGRGDELMKALDETDFPFPDQGALLTTMREGELLEIPGDFNYCSWTDHSGNSVIVHYAAIPNWREDTLVQQYRAMSWDEILER